MMPTVDRFPCTETITHTNSEWNLINCVLDGCVAVLSQSTTTLCLGSSHLTSHMTCGRERVVHGSMAKSQCHVEGVMRVVNTGTKYDLQGIKEVSEIHTANVLATCM